MGKRKTVCYNKRADLMDGSLEMGVVLIDIRQTPHSMERRKFLEVIAILNFMLGVLRLAFDVYKYFDAKK
ncbi:hypothetical protein ACI1UM_10640 [Lactococcus petauri]|uniref:hypothetical protein n=1 Tax=Lactococcus petauri TaxID=1940789 RepID=UPI00385524F8